MKLIRSCQFGRLWRPGRGLNIREFIQNYHFGWSRRRQNRFLVQKTNFIMGKESRKRRNLEKNLCDQEMKIHSASWDQYLSCKNNRNQMGFQWLQMATKRSHCWLVRINKLRMLLYFKTFCAVFKNVSPLLTGSNKVNV